MIYYLPRTIFPVYIGFCLSKKDWDDEMKRLKIQEPSSFVAGGKDAAACRFFHKEHGNTYIICFDIRDVKKHDEIQIIALLTHEITHVCDFIFEDVGEDKPGSETRAYLMQFMIQNILYEFYRRKKKLKK